jgi:peptidoglycan/LPS O-acetylase OafA/YrhL
LENRLRAPLIVFGWTLVFEMFFYYVLSLNLLIGKKAVILRSIACITLLVAIGAAVGFKRPILVLVANPINLEFVLGCCTALLFTRLGRRPTLGLMLVFAGVLLLAATVVFGFGHIDDAALTLNSDGSWLRLFLWGIPAAILSAGFIFRPMQMHSTFGRLWVFLGDASYSIYLTSAVSLYLASRFFKLIGSLPPDLNIVLLVLFVTIAGSASYLLVERPITQFFTEAYLQARTRMTLQTAG